MKPKDDNQRNGVQTVFFTGRLVLSPYRESDAEDLFLYASDPDVGPRAGWRPHESVEESRRTIEEILSVKECYAIRREEDGKAIGAILLQLDSFIKNGRENECELGYWIGKPFWGRGLIPEAAETLLSHAFDDLGIDTVWCRYYDGNEQSARVQEKLGFLFHHTEERFLPAFNETRTSFVNVLTREGWETRKNG